MNNSIIFKQPVHLANVTSLDLPKSARIVHFGRQPNNYMIWYSFEEGDQSLIQRHFSIIGTGHQFPTNSHHRGSCIDGPYVWHLIELPSQEKV